MATYASFVIFCVILGNHAVASAGYNETCSQSALCDQDLKCESGTCVCADGYYYSSGSASNCTQKPIIGESCPENVCVDTAVCVLTSSNSSICQCPTETYKQNDTTCVPQSEIGESCNVDAACPGDAMCVQDGNSGPSLCQCPSDFYKLNGTMCALKIDHAEVCFGVSDECGTPDTSCQYSQNGLQQLCLCGPNYFWNDTSSSCENVDALKVTNQEVVSTTENSAVLSWTKPQTTLNLDFQVSGGGTPGQFSESGSTVSTTVTGLTPGTSYVFSVVTVLPFNNNYGVIRSPAVQIQPAWTKTGHGGECDDNVNCVLGPTICRSDISGTSRCLCRDDYFWYNQACQSVDALKVTNQRVESTTVDSAVLSWTKPQTTLNLDFEVSVGGTPGQFFESVSTVSTTVTDLTPGTSYVFSVVTVLSANYYGEIRSPAVQTQPAWTKTGHGGECDDNVNCVLGPTICRSDISGTSRCLCRDDYFWYNQACQS
ncbi:hypothetical protein EGW08_020617, partial [Elysia chlorotica]